MIDDHDRCEWVNVSYGTISPRLSGQNPESHKTVVCVHVFDVDGQTSFQVQDTKVIIEWQTGYYFKQEYTG